MSIHYLLTVNFIADEFCDSYPHHIHPTPGYWIECSRAISNRGSAWTNNDCGDLDLAEVDEGITNSPDGSLRLFPFLGCCLLWQ